MRTCIILCTLCSVIKFRQAVQMNLMLSGFEERKKTVIHKSFLLLEWKNILFTQSCSHCAIVDDAVNILPGDLSILMLSVVLYFL